MQKTLLDQLHGFDFDVRLFYLDEVERQPLSPAGYTEALRGRAAKSLGLPAVVKRLCALGRDCDLLFGMQDGRPVDLAVLVGRILRRPAIGWVHNLPSRTDEDFPGSHPWITRFFYPRATWLVAVSDGVAEDLVRWMGDAARNVISLPNPVDISALRRSSEQPLPDWAQPIFARKVILGMGWLIRRKGFDLLMRSFATVVESGHDVNLLILGEGEERAALEAQAEDLGVRSRVFMPGYCPDPYPFLARAEAFVLSSRHEGLPTVLLEAMSLGVPVVAFDCPSGPAEILEGGRYGKLVPRGNPQAMADVIGNLLSSPELRAHYRRLGLERAMPYDAPVVARQFEALFRDALDGRDRRIPAETRSRGMQAETGRPTQG